MDIPLIGLTLIKDGNLLGYPWRECVGQLLGLCDFVLVNCGKSSDTTLQELKVLQTLHPYRLFIFSEKWDMSNTGDGRELARQANIPLKNFPIKKNGNEWIVYCQADEIIHEDDFDKIKQYVKKCSKQDFTQIELLRTYFWSNLQTRNTQHEMFLGRIFKLDTHDVGGDGMYLNRHSGRCYRPPQPINLYHYSRIGPEQTVTQRIRQLDYMFHEKEKVGTFPAFSYSEADSKKLISYTGTHPKGINEFYRK